jgi:hypothetical protein
LLVFSCVSGGKECDIIFDCSKEPCEDCAFIDSKLMGRADYNFSVELCRLCQGATCGTMGCQAFPGRVKRCAGPILYWHPPLFLNMSCSV